MEEPGRLQSMGSQRVPPTEHLHFHFFTLRGLELLLNLSTISMTDTVVYCVCVCVCVCVCSHSIMSESSATPFSPPGFSVHGTFLARILEWVATFSSKGSSWPRDRIRISFGSCIDRWFFNTEPPETIHICMYVCLYICIHIYFRFLSVIITRF